VPPFVSSLPDARASLVIVTVNEAARRDAAIERMLRERTARPATVLVEGALVAPKLAEYDRVRAYALGFGCPCCIGAFPLFVTLTRILRQEHPKLIVLAPLPGAHGAALVTFLTEKFAQHVQIENISF